MDPDIKFPECEKQYECDIEYIRKDVSDAQVAAVREEALREAAKLCSLKLAEPWTDTTTIIPNEYTAEVIRRKIVSLIEKEKTDG
jgi:hypothetical protein